MKTIKIFLVLVAMATVAGAVDTTEFTLKSLVSAKDAVTFTINGDSVISDSLGYIYCFANLRDYASTGKVKFRFFNNIGAKRGKKNIVVATAPSKASLYSAEWKNIATYDTTFFSRCSMAWNDTFASLDNHMAGYLRITVKPTTTNSSGQYLKMLMQLVRPGVKQ
jgi:hypothetical protein